MSLRDTFNEVIFHKEKKQQYNSGIVFFPGDLQSNFIEIEKNQLQFENTKKLPKNLSI